MSAFYNPVSKYEEQVEFDGVTMFEVRWGGGACGGMEFVFTMFF